MVEEQLTRYRNIEGRLKVLETYSIGCGYTVSRLNEDDHLQELHKRLRRMPSYMYLSAKEQRLENTASAYLKSYPAGTRSQLGEVKKCQPMDAEDRKLLADLQRKIAKVIEARTGKQDGYEAILEQLAEYQDLKLEKKKIDDVLSVLEEQHAELAKLLRLRYIDGLTVVKVCGKLAVVEKTYFRWRSKAVKQYARLSGF